jgi:hypothetical protein
VAIDLRAMRRLTVALVKSIELRNAPLAADFNCSTRPTKRVEDRNLQSWRCPKNGCPKSIAGQDISPITEIMSTKLLHVHQMNQDEPHCSLAIGLPL